MEDPRPPMSARSSPSLVEEILARSVDDWLHVADFSAVASRCGITDAEAIRGLAIGLIAVTVCDGLMVIGDVDASGFHRWPGSTGETLIRLIEVWNPHEPYPTPGSVAWLDCTPKGLRIGNSVLDRGTAFS